MSGEQRLNRCGCCKGIERLTPELLFNRPGLERLVYRIGTHASFKESMLAELSTLPRLRALTTRQDDDLGIAMLDAWAVVLDILTFYQERIANEGFLRTADERRSLLELARLIGYELGPGVAASTYLAFTLDDREGSPTEIVIPKGTQAQSIPGQNELPQTFETATELVARPQWSAFRPRLTHTQTFHHETRVFYVAGIATQLDRGDPVLLVSSPGNGDPQQLVLLKVIELETYSDIAEDVQWTKLTLAVDPPPAAMPALFALSYPAAATFSYDPQTFTATNVDTQLFGKTWTSGLLGAYTQSQGWPSIALGNYLAKNRSVPPSAEAGDGLYALRTRASAFGHNAPRYNSMTSEFHAAYSNNWDGDGAITDGTAEVPNVNENSSADAHVETGNVIYLDREYPDIVQGSFVVVTSPATDDEQVFKADAVSAESRADFGLSAKATKLTLAELTDAAPSEVSGLGDIRFREATIHTQSERLELIELPIEDDVAGDELELEQVDLLLHPGRTVIVRGERADLPGVIDSEAAVIREVQQIDGYTRLLLEEELANAYLRTTTTIYANVMLATHGESKRQILGSGDASRPFQRFELKNAPLTYVSAKVPGGAVSTAEVRVDGVLWHESPDFYRLGPSARNYVLRRDDDGRTQVLFGDGARGARLPTGSENVVLDYRVGIGTAGHVDPGRITLLASPPLGVREVTNPVAASGGEDPETRDEARDNAPTTVRTLDRIVSLTDFEDFARNYGGIEKARADWIWDGTRRLVFVTVAGADGDEVSAKLLGDLRDSMDEFRDPFQPMGLGNYRSLFFTLQADFEIHPDYLAGDVLARVEEELRKRFSFAARRFAEGVHPSEIVAAMHEVEGMVGVDLNQLELVPASGSSPVARIDAAAAEPGTDADGNDVMLGAELLVLTPEPLDLKEMP
jgi:predicted phage baseplate assembly protein